MFRNRKEFLNRMALLTENLCANLSFISSFWLRRLSMSRDANGLVRTKIGKPLNQNIVKSYALQLTRHGPLRCAGLAARR
jgi:hypothetical protein